MEVKKDILNKLKHCLKLNENTNTLYLNSIKEFKNNFLEDLSNKYEELINRNQAFDENIISFEDLTELRSQVSDAKFQMARKREYQLDAANLENLIKLQPDNIELQEELKNINQQIYFIDVENEGWEELEARMLDLEEQYRFQIKNETFNNEVKFILNEQKEELQRSFDDKILMENKISENLNLVSELLQTQLKQLEKEFGVSISEKEVQQKSTQVNKDDVKVEEEVITILDIALPTEGYLVVQTNPVGFYELLVEEEDYHTEEIQYSNSGEKYQDFEKLIKDLLSTKLTKGYPNSIVKNYRACLKTILNEQILLRLNNDAKALHDDFFEEKEKYHDMSLLKLWEIKLKCKFNFDTFQMEDL